MTANIEFADLVISLSGHLTKFVIWGSTTQRIRQAQCWAVVVPANPLASAAVAHPVAIAEIH